MNVILNVSVCVSRVKFSGNNFVLFFINSPNRCVKMDNSLLTKSNNTPFLL